MKAKTFLGKLKVTIGEYENMVTLLLVAPSEEQAHVLLDEAARSYYGGEEDDHSESSQHQPSYSSNGGEVEVEPAALKEIGLSTFLDLQACFMVRRHATVKMPSLEDLEALKPAAKALHSALVCKQIECTHLEVLDALASSWGSNSWQVLKERQGLTVTDAGLSVKLMSQLIAAAQQVCDNSSDEGCTDDLVVTSASAVALLEGALAQVPNHLR